MKKGKDKKNKSLESKSSPPSPGEKRFGNSPKRSRTELSKPTSGNEMNNSNALSTLEYSNLDMVANQVTIESSPSPLQAVVNNRLEFINSQKGNRYSPSNGPPFLVHIESMDGNSYN